MRNCLILLLIFFLTLPGLSKAQQNPQYDLGHWVLEVILDPNRDDHGQATLLTESGYIIFGPVPVLGRSSDTLARLHNNPDRNPLLPYGDTPTGTYISWVRSTEEKNSNGQVYSQVRSQSGNYSYGNSGLLVLQPESGQAKLAEANGRVGLLAHEGTVGRNYGLRPTAGCLRFYPEDMKQLVSYMAQYREVFTTEVSIGKVEIWHPVPYARNDPDEEAIDPPPLLDESDPWLDDWTTEMWDLILDKDQYVETGEMYADYLSETYGDLQEARIEDLISQGMDAARAAQYGGGGVEISSGDRKRGSRSSNGGGGQSRGNGRASDGGGGYAEPQCAGPPGVICVPF